MSEEDLISTFMRTLGSTYQLMLLTASQNNFAKVVNKAIIVELAIKAGLVHEASLAPASSSENVPKKAAATRSKANLVHAIEVPLPSQNCGHVLPLRQLTQSYPAAMNIIPPQTQQFYQPRYPGAPGKEKKKRKFTLLPYSYKYIIKYLIKKKLLQLIDPRPPPYPLPYYYN